MENLKERLRPDKELVRVEGFNWKNWGCCLGCQKPLKKWEGAYYGVFSDFCSLFDIEYSHFTGYCEECAKEKALESRQHNHPTCPPVVERIENIYDGGYLCTRKVFADGSVVESTAESIKNAI